MIFIVTVALVSQFVMADPLTFGQAALKLDVYETSKLKRDIDNLALQNAVTIQNDVQSSIDLMNDYNIRQSKPEALELKIIANTTLDKTRLGNQIKDMGYLIEENATFLGFRKLYLGAFSAQKTLELEQLKYANQQHIYSAEQVKHDKGMITSLQLKQSEQALIKAENAVKLAQIDFDGIYAKLNNMAHGEVILSAETAKVDAMQPIDYYLNFIDNRFEIKSLVIKNQIKALELPYYEEEYNFTNAQIVEDYDAIKDDIKLNELNIEQQRYAIKKELQQAYIDIEQATNQLSTLKQKLTDIHARYQQMQVLLDKGYISQAELNAFKVNIKQLDNAYQLASISFNTKRLAFTYATSVGPVY